MDSPDSKPSIQEQKYFADEEARLTQEWRERLNAQRAEQRRSVHFMKCPKCGGDLAEHEHDQVKVDRCPDCGGVWLDNGELELLEHRSRTAEGPAGGGGSFFSALFKRS
jgi:uncharacterized C2H2 Zn-finger protein